jgi:endoplasmic reticulum-Golgi intermediate compartment protein 3
MCSRTVFTPDPVNCGLTVSYKENLVSQSHEGCNLAGFIQVNKVTGNFHIAPGRSFNINGVHAHDVVLSSRFDLVLISSLSI